MTKSLKHTKSGQSTDTDYQLKLELELELVLHMRRFIWWVYVLLSQSSVQVLLEEQVICI